ncbi:ArsR/SmtB family transcription factor [Peribacillus sp. SCS-155]|uniref:ArsR/SmtB family transcription factor n=1 Tax=Peribacillus sedimenti TaxID=3115297 RepID=UPI003906CF1D
MPTKESLDIAAVAGILKLLGDKTRLTMVKMMSERECCVCDLVDVFDMSQPAISQHIRKMKDSGLIKERRGAQWIYYSLNPESAYYDFVMGVIRDLPRQIHKIEKTSQTCCD